jgi:hypothetical protein
MRRQKVAQLCRQRLQHGKLDPVIVVNLKELGYGG